MLSSLPFQTNVQEIERCQEGQDPKSLFEVTEGVHGRVQEPRVLSKTLFTIRKTRPFT